jgi:hypothetical protein
MSYMLLTHLHTSYTLRSNACTLRYASCKVRYASCTLCYAFRRLRYTSCTLRYVSCTLRFLHATLRFLHVTLCFSHATLLARFFRVVVRIGVCSNIICMHNIVLDQATPQFTWSFSCKHSLTSFSLRRLVGFIVALLTTKSIWFFR